MRTKFTLLFMALATFSFAQNVNIPDPNFKNVLVNHHLIYEFEDENGNDIQAEIIDTNGDGEISKAEAQAFNGYLICYGQNISNLTGIEEFINIKRLICMDNNISNLNVSNNLALEMLDCAGNNISNLDLSNNLSIKWLDCSGNNISSLDLSNNSNLIFLDCEENQLTSLNVKNGNNQNFLQDEDDFEYLFFAEDNPNLTCIEVDNANWSTTNWTNIDDQTTFSENCGFSVNDFFATSNFSFYPNPVNDILHFSANSKIENITINNLLGQEVKANINYDKTSLDMSNLPSGNYFVKITIEGVSKTIKVVKS